MTKVRLDDSGRPIRRKPRKRQRSNKPVGRPTKYNKVLGRKIAELVADGWSVSQICKDEELKKELGIPNRSTVLTWVRDIEEFRNVMDQAMVERSDFYLDKMYDLIEKMINKEITPHEARVAIDTYKWIACKLHPRYADKPNQTINVDGGDGGVQFQITLADPNQRRITNGVQPSPEEGEEGQIINAEVVEDD